MEALLFLCCAALFVLLWRTNSRLKRDREEDREKWLRHSSRISAVEQALTAMRAESSAAADAKYSKPQREPAEQQFTPGEQQSKPAEQQFKNFPWQPVQPAAPQVEETISAAAENFAETIPAETLPEVAPPPVSDAASEEATKAPAAPARPEPTFPSAKETPAPIFAHTSAHADSAASGHSWHDIEEILGTNWLNKVGIALLVLGVAFFLALQLKTLGPAGKVLVGFVTGGVMLAAAIWLERKHLYRIMARAAIGGGWALLFFTTYAMYHVPPARVLHSQAVDLLLMLAVAIVMVLHTLRFRSQVVTGMAFLLAFLTVTVNHSNVYSLSAGVVLAAGLAVIVVRMKWYELEVFGILASYANHYLWLRPIIEPMQGKHHPFPEFFPSVGILACYWLIFRISYVLRLPEDQERERISTVAALLNPVLLLTLLKYQSVHPEWTFWALLAFGAVETALGQLPITKRRRSAVIVLSTLGVVLLIAAFPFRYSGARLSVLWLLEAQALLLIGVWTKEIIFRRLGVLAGVLVAGQMISYDAARIFGRRMDDADLRPDFALVLIFLAAALVFYANAHWVARRWAELFSHEIDDRVIRRITYVACLMLLIAAWLAFPESWTAVAWCALGLLLAHVALRLELPELTYQANFLALASVGRVLCINFEDLTKIHRISVRLVSVALVAGLLYLSARRNGNLVHAKGRMIGEQTAAFARFADGVVIGNRVIPWPDFVEPAYTWTASLLLGFLVWYELRSLGVADAWLLGGLVLLEVGLTRAKLSFRSQAYAAFAASFIRIFFVNLGADGLPGEISPRFYSVVPLMFGFYYVYARLRGKREELSATEQKFHVDDVTCWLGSVTAVALVRFEVPADWVATAWSAVIFALLLLAWRSARPTFTQQGLLLALCVLFRTVMHNFYERSYFPAPVWESRWITVGSAIAILFFCLPLAFKIRGRSGKEYEGDDPVLRTLYWLLRIPEQVLFFVPVILLTWLLEIEMRYGMVTLAWGVEGVAIFVVALWGDERSFRLTGLGVLLLCVGKILVVDVWQLDPRDRYLTFIVLGAALLLVSYLYTRNRQLLRQYL
jgi:uncharacterized membrane protein